MRVSIPCVDICACYKRYVERVTGSFSNGGKIHNSSSKNTDMLIKS